MQRKKGSRNVIKAPDKMLARRADTRARADFATWKMMAKLNGGSSLSAQAQDFLVKYKSFLDDMPEAQASEATIGLITKSYYTEMGGIGTPPPIPVASSDPDYITDNVTAFRRPSVSPPKGRNAASQARPKLPAGLIFVGLAAVYVAIRLYLG
jgi:hypothetical protein